MEISLLNRYSVEDIFEPEEDYLLRHSVSIILFTLRQLDEQQRLIFVQKCYFQLILQFWQYWPIHDAILPLFKAVISAMDEAIYKKLFVSLLKSIGPYTPKNRLLFQMWLSSPSHLQNQITESEREEMLRDYDDRRFDQKLLQILSWWVYTFPVSSAIIRYEKSDRGFSINLVISYGYLTFDDLRGAEPV